MFVDVLLSLVLASSTKPFDRQSCLSTTSIPTKVLSTELSSKCQARLQVAARDALSLILDLKSVVFGANLLCKRFKEALEPTHFNETSMKLQFIHAFTQLCFTLTSCDFALRMI